MGHVGDKGGRSQGFAEGSEAEVKSGSQRLEAETWDTQPPR